jgi:ABC-2 type transport system ATP-binding protein
MSKELIKVSNLTFHYRVIKNRSSSLKELVREIFHRRVRLITYVALENITFSVREGEVLAVLGRNGAGKSTLLKVLAGVVPPTTGLCETTGKIAPMIELAAGFHPELTGRENILFYSALMGRNINNVKRSVEAIGEWAGVQDHIDFPLRTFSSGMIARLAFATATSETADIVLIDEVLSVGDAEFQSKSRKRMKELINSGSAVVLVSHDMNAIRELATRAIWIEKGKIVSEGTPREVIKKYSNFFRTKRSF